MHNSVPVVPEQILFKPQAPASIVFPYPSFFFGTPDENDELRFHCAIIM
jgi:hypothetical protein